MKNLFRLIVCVLSLTFCLSLSSCVMTEKPNETTLSPDTTLAPETTPTPETTLAPETTSTPETISTPETTPTPETTSAPETASSPETTSAPETTLAPETTPTPETTLAPETTPTPETTSAPETTPIKPTYPTMSQMKARSSFYTIIDAHLDRLTPEQRAGNECITLNCYGIYKSNSTLIYVMRIIGPYIPSFEDPLYETIGDQDFIFTNGRSLEVFIMEPYNNRICTLKEAYEAGMITNEQLATVNERYRQGKAATVRSEDLTIEYSKEKLITAYAEKNSIDPKSIYLRYLGCYNRACVTFIEVPDVAYLDMIYEVQIGDQTIVYGNSQFMTVFYKGEFYSLEKAFEDGILTNEDLADINEKHRGRLYVVTKMY